MEDGTDETEATAGVTQSVAMSIAFIIVSLWWIGCSLPLLKKYRQTAFQEATQAPVKDAFRQLLGTLKAAKAEKLVFNEAASDLTISKLNTIISP